MARRPPAAGFALAMLLSALVALSSVTAKVYFQETFDDSWKDRWTKSTWKQDDGTAGEFELTAGLWYGDEEADKGIKTTPDARFYSVWAEMEEPFDNKDKDLVLQFSAKHEQKLDCGGGYIKLLPESSKDQMEGFGGDTPYSIMFGPDICGYSTKKVHVILTYKDKNHLIKEDVKCKTDQLTHVYTLLIRPNNTYAVYIDIEEVQSGSLYEHWDMLPPAKIKDPDAKKPEDWDERKKIPDPEDKKPEGWDDIPEFIADPNATKPEEWEEDDGEWEPPNIPNPDFKGEWKPKMIDNPDYKGKWEPPEIDNPEYVHDDTLYHLPPLKFVGFELWQVKSGTIFDNIIVTDDFEAAKKFAEDTWGKTKDGEKEMFDKAEEERKAKEEEERKQREEERKQRGEDEEDDEDGLDDDYEGLDDDYADALKEEL